MKSRKFCGICLAQYNLSVIKSLIMLYDFLPQSLHKALSLCKCSSSEWSVPSILVLYHIIHKPNLDSLSCGHNTHKCQRNTQKSIHSPVAETKHNPLTWIGCSGKLCIKRYNTVKLGAEHTCYYAAQRAMPECQRGRERNVYSRWPAAGVSGIPLLLTKEQETGRLAQPCISSHGVSLVDCFSTCLWRGTGRDWNPRRKAVPNASLLLSVCFCSKMDS